MMTVISLFAYQPPYQTITIDATGAVVNTNSSIVFTNSVTLSGGLNSSAFGVFYGITNNPASASSNIFEWAKMSGTYGNQFTTKRTKNESGVIEVGNQDIVFTFYNNSGSAMTAGQAVYVSGVTNNAFSGMTNIPVCALAKADSTATMPVFGIVQMSVPNNSYGRVIHGGILSGIPLILTNFTAGQQLYLSATSAGGITNTRPVSPLYANRVGVMLGDGAMGVVIAPFIGGVESGTTSPTWTSSGNIVIGGGIIITNGMIFSAIPNTTTTVDFSVTNASVHSVTSGFTFTSAVNIPSDGDTSIKYQLQTPNACTFILPTNSPWNIQIPFGTNQITLSNSQSFYITVSSQTGVGTNITVYTSNSNLPQ